MYTLLKKVLNSLFLSSILSTGEYAGLRGAQLEQRVSSNPERSTTGTND